MTVVRDALEPIAAFFRSLNMPEPIIHWGHPVMMATVVFVLGTAVGIAGWRGRLLAGSEAALKPLADHRKFAPLMTLFIILGYSGGVLSLVMQQQPILESPHFWTGSTVVLLLLLNGTISLSGFDGNQASLRTAHALIGTLILGLLVVHAVLGLWLGVTI